MQRKLRGGKRRDGSKSSYMPMARAGAAPILWCCRSACKVQQPLRRKTLQKFMLCLRTQSVWLPLHGYVAAAYVELQNGLVPGNQKLSMHAANSG
jgi:hypothetical protein